LTLMKAGIDTPGRLLDIKRLDGLSREIEATPQGVVLGALAPLAAIETHASIQQRNQTLERSETVQHRSEGACKHLGIHKNTVVAKADRIIEAVPEHIDIKHKVYQSIEPHMKIDAVLATNTSSLPLDKLTERL